MAVGFPLFLLRAFMTLFMPTYGCYSPQSPWWHMLGNKAGSPYLSGNRRRRGGICMLVSIYRLGEEGEGGEPSCARKKGLSVLDC